MCCQYSDSMDGHSGIYLVRSYYMLFSVYPIPTITSLEKEEEEKKGEIFVTFF